VFPSVQLTARTAPNLGSPWVNNSGDLGPHSLLGEASMGPELSLGRELFWNGMPNVVLGKIAIPGTTATNWNDTLAADVTSFITDLQTSSGEQLGSVVISLGTNDTGLALTAAAYQAKLTSFVAGIRAAFGSTVVVALIETPEAVSASFVATVRAGAAAFIAADPLAVLIKANDVALVDGFHFTSEGYNSIGQRAAFGVLDTLGVARRAVSTANPEVVGWGGGVNGTGTLSPRSWPGGVDGDLELLLVTTGMANTPATLSTAAGFTEVVGAEQSSSWAGTFYRRSKVWSRVVTQATLDANDGLMPTPVSADVGDVLGAKMFTVRGASGTPTIDAVSGNVNNGSGTSLSLTSPTTTVDNCLILYLLGAADGVASNSGTITNTSLTDVTEHQDAHFNGSDHVLMIAATGVKAAAGPLGAATVTTAFNTQFAGISIALAP
jgi:lysophospholipase L1-like esterase